MKHVKNFIVWSAFGALVGLVGSLNEPMGTTHFSLAVVYRRTADGLWRV